MPISMAENNAPAAKAAGEGEQTDAKQDYWKKELARSEKYFQPFWSRADKLYKLYAKQGEDSDAKRRFAMLWSNTEVLKPSVYARPPVPNVSRRYRDRDPVGRLAAEILERASGFEFERMNLDSTLRAVRDDLLLPGRGTAWVSYEAEIEEPEEPGETPDDLPVQGQPPAVTEHKTMVDYIHYRQFLHEPARRWEEVGWVAKKAYLTDEEGKARFKDKWKGVALDNKADQTGGDSDSVKDPKLENAQSGKATVYEIWCKPEKKVYFIAKSASQVLEVSEPLLDFEGFFPCPKPVYATVTNNSLIPTPDYKYYQDQAEEIDQLTARIGKLIDSLKLVGFYPAGAEGDVSEAMEKALSPATESKMIPVASWAAFGERGGSNAIIWLPIKEVVETINACIEVRNQCVQDTYQITGISDILRGATESGETATAQSIKAQWGSIRIRDRQQELVRFARDLTRMVCEVISEQYDPQYLMQMTNIDVPEPPQPPPEQPPMQPPQPTGDPQQDQAAQQQMQQMMQQQQAAQQAFQQQMQAYQAEMKKISDAFALLKNDDMRGYRIEIETDSTIQPDEDAEKQRRTEFVTAMGSMMQQAMPMVLQAPELAPMLSETIMFTARGFRAGRALEDVIEQSFKALGARLGQPQQKPDPNAAMMQAKQQQAQLDLKITQDKAQLDLQHTKQANDLAIQHMQEKHQAELSIKQQQADHALSVTQQTNELGLSQGKAKLRDQILAEEQDAFLGQPGEQVNGVAQVLQLTLGQLMEAVTNSNNQVLTSNQQLLTALTAPKVITAPDGRQYTAQTAVN